MTYVISEACVGVKDASCVDVCPVECIHALPEHDSYFIDQGECIDCGVCVPECPVDAIFPDHPSGDARLPTPIGGAPVFPRTIGGEVPTI